MKKPFLSIITPSYNQGKFISDTLDSILEQSGIENLVEYIIQDGGSTDDTMNIIKKFAPKFRKKNIYLKYISEKDNGQSDAINKGWNSANGEVLCYINSDDYYEPNSLLKIIEFFEKNKSVMWAYGNWNYVDKNKKLFKSVIGGKFNKEKLLEYDYIGQPAVFIRKTALKKVGLLNQELNLTMDYDLWLRLANRYNAKYIKDVKVANLRCYTNTKSSKYAFKQFFSVYRLSRKYPSSLETKIKRFFYLFVGLTLALLKLDIANRIDKGIKLPFIDHKSYN